MRGAPGSLSVLQDADMAGRGGSQRAVDAPRPWAVWVPPLRMCLRLVFSGRHLWRLWVALLCALVITLPAAAQGRNIALLIGVGDYGHARLNLEGPVHDVPALRSVLQRRWGFAEADIVTLVDAQATREAVLRALRDLQWRSGPGDQVLIYFSGHGLSALQGAMEVPVPHGSGAFVPFGVNTQDPAALARGMIVGRTDLQPLLRELDRGSRRVWVVSDSCYSGQQVRSLLAPDDDALVGRFLPLAVSAAERDMLERDRARLMGRPVIDPYPYRAVAYLAASAEGEIAKDIPAHLLSRYPTVDGRPHGALTDALLRVLEGRVDADFDRDGMLSLNEVLRAVGRFMAQRAYGHTPQRLPAVGEDEFGLGARPVLAASGMARAPSAAGPADQPLRVALSPLLPPTVRLSLAAVPDVMPTTGNDFDIQVAPLAGRWVVRSAAGDLLTSLPTQADQALREQVIQFAWARRLQTVAERHQRAVLPLELHPPEFGGNFLIGSRIHFVVRPDRPAWLLLLNVDAAGKVSVLYPYTRAELQPLSAVRARAIPGDSGNDRIQVQAPEGMDVQFAFAFDAEPPQLRDLMGLAGVTPGHPRLALLEPMLESMLGRYSFAMSHLRVSAPRAAGGRSP